MADAATAVDTIAAAVAVFDVIVVFSFQDDPAVAKTRSLFSSSLLR